LGLSLRMSRQMHPAEAPKGALVWGLLSAIVVRR
jgi:hypothetical protein